MTPSPPCASTVSVQESSPDSTEKPVGRSRRIVRIWSRFALRLLDGHDPGMLGEAQQRRRLDVHARPAGHVVDHDRQVALVGDRPVVRLEHPLVGLVVVRRDDEGRVGAERGRSARGGDRRCRVVRAGAGDDGDVPAAARLRRAASTVQSMSASRSSLVGQSWAIRRSCRTGTRPSMPAGPATPRGRGNAARRPRRPRERRHESR